MSMMVIGDLYKWGKEEETRSPIKTQIKFRGKKNKITMLVRSI